MVDVTGQIKQPIVNLYNLRTELVASTRMGDTSGVGVVSFKYKYDDDTSDECIIKIQASHTQWLDKLNITINTGNSDVKNKIIHLAWGYVGEKITTRRTVVVQDIKSNYGSNIIYTELICKDFSTYLKLTQSPFIEKITPIEYIRQYCTGNTNVIIKAHGKLLYQQNIDEKYGQTEDSLEVTVIDRSDIWGYIGDLNNVEIPEKSKFDRTDKVISRDVQVGKWYDIGDTTIREFFEKERDVNVISKSPYAVIKGIMHKAPNGPWFVTGRDNSIIIHNRTLSSGNYRDLEYNKGEGNIIGFSVETKYESFMKRTISYNNMDPETKKAKFLDTYIKSLLKSSSPEEILKANIPDDEREKKLQEWLSLYQGGYQNFKTLYSKYELTAEGNMFLVDNYRQYDPSKEKKRLLNPLVGTNYGPSDFVDLSQVIQDGIYYTTPVSGDDEELNLVNNASRQLAMEKEEAKIIIEGDPNISSGLTVGVSGVQRLHIGNYYIKSCEHTISNTGYKVTLETFKVVDDTGVLQYKTSETYERSEEVIQGDNKDTIKLSHREKFDIEGNLFRNWSIKVRGSGRTKYSANIGLSSGTAETVYEYIDLREYIKRNPDTNAADLIELYRTNKVRIEDNTEER